MIDGAAWLGLEVKRLAPARDFYGGALDLPIASTSADAVTFGAGRSRLILRTPGAVPRGGLHTHFAFAISQESYDGWWERLDREFDLSEHRFGDTRSLYLYDPAGNCVELGGAAPGAEEGIQDIFEVVLEVESLDRSAAFYTALGFEVIDRGSDRRRIRLTAGHLDLELWEPHLGIADARGGVHVDLGLATEDPGALADRVVARALASRTDGPRRLLQDPDGHWLTLVPE